MMLSTHKLIIIYPLNYSLHPKCLMLPKHDGQYETVPENTRFQNPMLLLLLSTALEKKKFAPKTEICQ